MFKTTSEIAACEFVGEDQVCPVNKEKKGSVCGEGDVEDTVGIVGFDGFGIDL
jgi:hypothetical protein